MDSELAAFAHADPVGETATHPLARLVRRLAALLLVAGNAMRLVAPCQAAHQTHTRARPTAVSRLIGSNSG